MEATSQSFFLLPGYEIVLYVPYGGTSRSIPALVSYMGPRQMAGLRGGSRPQYELLVKNDPTEGISMATIDTARDKVHIPLRLGRAAKTVRIVKIISQDKAMLRLLAW